MKDSWALHSQFAFILVGGVVGRDLCSDRWPSMHFVSFVSQRGAQDMINHTDDSPEAYIASSSESEPESESESAESDSSESGSESWQQSDGCRRMPAASPPNLTCVAQELSVASLSNPDCDQHSHLEHSHTAQIPPSSSIHSCNGSTKPAPSQPCDLPLHPQHQGPQPDPVSPGSTPDPSTVSGYRRRNSIYTSRALREGQEVHFTYHKGLRPDEYV